MNYLPRVADQQLAARLGRSGAVLVEGAKWCGKTQTSLQSAASVVHVDTDLEVDDLMEIDPTLVLEGPTPRLLDEWQWQPRLWDYVRHAVDNRNQAGQFILTGSAMPVADLRRHSGAGRFSVLRMRPMSLWESGQSNGQVSWSTIRNSEAVRAAASPWSLTGIAEAVVRGGWPATVGLATDAACEYVLDYLDLLADADLSRLSQSRHDPVRVRSLLASLGRNTATPASINTLVSDLGETGASLGRDTASGYLAALEQLMILENQPAWSTALRDSARLRRTPKRHLVCPSLAAAAIGATVKKLAREPKTLGVLFESMAVRDLRVYAAVERGQVYHYRDSRGREIDAIVQYPDGWVGVEVKLGLGAVEGAATNLLKVVKTIDTQTVGAPDALVVITGGGPAYRRPDGVVVAPLNQLKP